MKKTSINKAVELLNQGEVVAFPTETVYGLGADAWNPSAVKKVFEVKGRPADNPLIVHIAGKKMVHDFVSEIPEAAKKLIDHFWPGPLTLIFKKKPEVLDLVTAGLDTVALRWPNHPVSQELIFRAGPLVAPSANKSGRPSPTKAEHVKEDFGDRFPVIDGGPTQIGLESTVLGVAEEPFRIYRPGYTGKEEIENLTGKQIMMLLSPQEERVTKSPGTKYTHYAPAALVRWMEADEKPVSGKTFYLFHSKTPEPGPSTVVYYEGDYQQMAHELYDRFRQADHENCRVILIESFPDNLVWQNPVAQALANRISKAAG